MQLRSKTLVNIAIGTPLLIDYISFIAAKFDFVKDAVRARPLVENSKHCFKRQSKFFAKACSDESADRNLIRGKTYPGSANCFPFLWGYYA